jgi:hypothetical protein
MQLDDQRIDDAVLALLAVFSFDHGRCWKTFSWEVMDRLHARDLIDNPRSSAKSVYLTTRGEERGMALAEQLFSKRVEGGG